MRSLCEAAVILVLLGASGAMATTHLTIASAQNSCLRDGCGDQPIRLAKSPAICRKQVEECQSYCRGEGDRGCLNHCADGYRSCLAS